MNEITRIHLAGVAYEIDLSAKKDLEKYLTAIKKSLGQDADAMEDIEIRMTEILAERGVTKDSVITEYDLKAIKARLGEPKDFSSDDDSGSGSDSDSAGETIAEKVGKVFSDKKFYRDPDTAIIGGVVSGLSAYTGWDVTLLRLLFVILAFLSFGFAVLLYLVVWIVAPAAKSTSEKLAMKGEPVNIDSIKAAGKEVTEKAKDLGEKAKKSTKTAAAKVEKTTEDIVAKAPSVGYTIGRILAILFGVVGLCICFGLLVSLAVGSVWAVKILLDFSLPTLPLIIATVATTLLTLLFIVIIGIVISVSLITGSFSSRTKRPGLVALVVIATLLLLSSLTTATVWTSINGTDSLKGAAHVIEERSHDFRSNFPYSIYR